MNEPLPKLNLPFSGRMKELFGPVLRVVHQIPILYESVFKLAIETVEKKKKSLKSSLEATILEVVVSSLFKDEINTTIEFPNIWKGLKEKLQADQVGNSLVLENGIKISKRKVAFILRDKLAGEMSPIHFQKTTTSAYRFEKEKLEKLAKKYEVPIPASQSPTVKGSSEKNERIKIEVVDSDKSSDKVD